jgi:hypothetical protein
MNTNYTLDELAEWTKNKLVNPRTKHKIKLNKKTYNKLNRYIFEYKNEVDNIINKDKIEYNLLDSVDD